MQVYTRKMKTIEMLERKCAWDTKTFTGENEMRKAAHKQKSEEK